MSTKKEKKEEITTLFMAGFPLDIQERESQNMFTFAEGFEYATLAWCTKKSKNSNEKENQEKEKEKEKEKEAPIDLHNGSGFESIVVDGEQEKESEKKENQEQEENQKKEEKIEQYPIGFALFNTLSQAMKAKEILSKKIISENPRGLKVEFAKTNLKRNKPQQPEMMLNFYFSVPASQSGELLKAIKPNSNFNPNYPSNVKFYSSNVSSNSVTSSQKNPYSKKNTQFVHSKN